MANRNNNRETGSNHIFSETGPQPWRWTGTHESFRPDVFPKIDNSKLKQDLHVQFFGIVRLHDGTFGSKGGLDFYGTAWEMNGWLARVLNNHADKVREIIVKRCFFEVDGETKGGRTPALKLKQETYVHLVLAVKAKKKIAPDQPKVVCNGKHVAIAELEGFDIQEDGSCVPYTNPKAKDIRAWLDSGYTKMTEGVAKAQEELAKAKKAVEEQLAEDNPLD